MEFFDLFGFLTILKESIKLLPKNGKLMAFIAIILILLSSSLFFVLSYSLQSLVVDMTDTVMKSMMPQMPDPTSYDPNNPSSFTQNPGFDPTQLISQLDHLKEDLALMLALEIAYVLIFFVISFFSSIATTLVSAQSYGGNTNLSIKDLFLGIRKTWKRPLITTLYVTGLGLGYFTLVLLLASPLFIYRNFITISILILLGAASFILYLYLVVVWFLAVVVSVVEESYYGVKALGKAAGLAKGKRFDGFMLNLFFSLLFSIISLSYRMTMGDKGLGNATVYGLVVMNASSLVKIFLCVAYTVLYFQCKKYHGEEIFELHGIVQYDKLPTVLLANAI